MSQPEKELQGLIELWKEVNIRYKGLMENHAEHEKVLSLVIRHYESTLRHFDAHEAALRKEGRDERADKFRAHSYNPRQIELDGLKRLYRDLAGHDYGD